MAAFASSPDCRAAPAWRPPAPAPELLGRGRADDPGRGGRPDRAVGLPIVGEHLPDLRLDLRPQACDLIRGADAEELRRGSKRQVELDGVIEVVADRDRQVAAGERRALE